MCNGPFPGRLGATFNVIAVLCAFTAVLSGTPLQERSETNNKPRAELREAELEFARSVAQRDRDSFLASIGDDAIFLSPAPLVGKIAIVQAWASFFEPDGPSLEWEPDIVEVQPGGNLGITHGPYRLTVKGEGGKAQIRRGTFTSIWRREPDGIWRIVFDSGCTCTSPD